MRPLKLPTFATLAILPLSMILILGSASAQQPAVPPPQGSNWQHVQALPAGTPVRLKLKSHQLKICTLKSADAETVVCADRKNTVIQRTDIQSVQLSHRSRSTLIGAAIGAGVGVPIGISVAHAEVPRWFALILAVPAPILGAAIGYAGDYTGSTIYKAP